MIIDNALQAQRQAITPTVHPDGPVTTPHFDVATVGPSTAGPESFGRQLLAVRRAGSNGSDADRTEFVRRGPGVNPLGGDLSVLAAMLVVVAAVGALVGLWMVQSPPPTLVDAAVPTVRGETPVADARLVPGDLVVVVEAGDSMWSLAAEHVPGADRRSAVEAMVDANDGAALVVGQAIVIPHHLLQ